MASTVLPDYVWHHAGLCVMVAVGVGVVGTATAAAVTLFEFPGRRSNGLLLLPLAMPAYVVAYAYTDFLQFSGPLQTGLRATVRPGGPPLARGAQPGGAVWVFTFSLYPYVYLLARTALGERAAHLMEAARLLGAPLSRRIPPWPAAGPPGGGRRRGAGADGDAGRLRRGQLLRHPDLHRRHLQGLAGHGQPHGRGAAGHHAAGPGGACCCGWSTARSGACALPRRAATRRRHRGAAGGAARRAPLAGLAGVYAARAGMGFVLPVAFMLRPLAADWSVLPWAVLCEWSWNSVRLGGVTAGLAVAVALTLAFAVRRRPDRLTRGVVQLAGLGYAVPGAVIVVGLLLPVGWLQAPCRSGAWARWSRPRRWAGVGVPGALLRSGAAVGAKRLCAHPRASLDDSARMLGAGGCALMARVHWPLLRRSTAAAALLVFVDVMKELPATMVLRPFNSDTLAVVAYQLARDEAPGRGRPAIAGAGAVGLVPVSGPPVCSAAPCAMLPA
jgi:iron(III) transport system permease protein